MERLWRQLAVSHAQQPRVAWVRWRVACCCASRSGLGTVAVARPRRLVVALDYANPYLNPYQEFQQWKRHPFVSKLLDGGTCLQYGARTLNEGGWQSIPALTFPGGALVGDSAGFLNVPKIKVRDVCQRTPPIPRPPAHSPPGYLDLSQGTHTAMKSGMLAAEAAFNAVTTQPGARPLDLSAYESNLRQSWVRDRRLRLHTTAAVPHTGAGVGDTDASALQGGARAPLRVWLQIAAELHRERNIRPSFNMGAGLLGGLAYSAVEAYLLRGKEPWTMRYRCAVLAKAGARPRSKRGGRRTPVCLKFSDPSAGSATMRSSSLRQSAS